MASQHALNHGGILIPDQKLTPKWLSERKDNITIQADIHNLKSIQALACLDADFWTVSFPCQSWTSSAYSKGLHDGNGHSFVQVMSLGRRMRPRIITLENVKQFRFHEQYAEACKIIHWCGFRILGEKVLNAQDRLPIQRPRWLAVLQRIEDPPSDFCWQDWGPQTVANPLIWDVWMPTDETELSIFQPTREAFQLYMDPSLLPKYAPYFAKENMWRYRFPNLQQKTPVYMAMYGSQHCLPIGLLQDRGLHGHMTVEECKPRFWKPAEIALLHTQKHPLCILRPVQHAWKSLGNCIILHHAFAAVINALSCLHPTPEAFHLPTAVELIEQHRFRANSVQVLSDEFGWCLANTEHEAAKMNQQIRHMATSMGWHHEDNPTWPPESFYDPTRGCCSIHADTHCEPTQSVPIVSPTLPYTAEAFHQDLLHQGPELDQDKDYHDTVALTVPDPTQLTQFALMAQQCDEMDTKMTPDHFFAAARCHDDESVASSETHNLPPSPQPMQDVDVMADWQQVTLFIIPGTYGILHVASDMTYDRLLRMWQFKLFPMETITDNHHLTELMNRAVQKTMLFPRTVVNETLLDDDTLMEYLEEHDHSTGSKPIVIVETSFGTCCVITNNGTWEDVCRRYIEFPEQAWSEWGPIQPDTKMNRSLRAHSQALPTQMYLDIGTILEHVQDVHLFFQIPPETDILVVHMYGDTDTLAAFATLWHVALDQAWQKAHGRQLTFQATSPGSIRFVIRPDGIKFATPTTILSDAIAAKLCQSLLPALSHQDNTHVLRIKDFVGIVADIQLGHQDQMPDIFKCLQHAFYQFAHGETPRLVCTGKQIHQEYPIEDLFQRHNTVTAHIVMPLRGGGGAKQDHRKSVHSILAALLVEHEIKLEDVSKYVDQLQDHFGLPKLSHVLFAHDEIQKQNEFRLLCNIANIPIATQTTPVADVKHKFQKIASKKPATKKSIDPSHYQLSQGFFKTAMGEDLPIHQHFTPCITGINMMKSEDAAPWMNAIGSLHTDEKAIFLIGEPPATKLTLQKLVAPAINMNGQACLISGYLVQLGEREVKWVNPGEDAIQCHEVQICSFTVWASDWKPELWRELQTSPVKQVRKILEADGIKFTMNTPFGRTYHYQQAPCPPEQSDSIQFHSEVRVSELRQLLRHSGFNGVYIVPKGEDGRPSQHWKVVWVDMPQAKIHTISMTKPFVAGLVKGRKAMGVRCETKHFAELWALFHPDTEAPKIIPDGDVYKVQNLPYGVDKEVLLEWLQASAWNAYPVKSIGPRTWLIKAAAAPDREVLCFNSMPVIVRKLQQKASNATGLVVGPRAQPDKTAKTGTVQTSAFRLGDPHMDPWKAAAGSLRTSTTSSSTVATPPQQGPTMSHLSQHDQQIAALESALQQVQQQQQLNTTKVESRLDKVEANLQAHAQETAATLQSIQKDFQESFRQALTHQDQKMQTTLDELKNLVLRADKRKKNRPERSEDSEEAEKETDEDM
eukprot:Skav209650  [mRNA]  locus=scaffold650:120319:124749:+ [translate_table: standard]